MADSSLLFVRSLHVLFVRGAGNVAGVIGQAHQLHLTHSALVSAVPGEGRRERGFNRSFRHGSDLVFVPIAACALWSVQQHTQALLSLVLKS